MSLPVSFGEAAGLGCALIWAVNGLILRTQLRNQPPVLVNSVRCAAGGLFVLALLPFGPPLSTFLEVRPHELALLIGSVLLAIGVGDTLYLAAIKEIGVSRALAIGGIHPLTTLLFEWALLGQPFTPMFVTGSCLVVGGVICLSARSPGMVSPTDAAPVRLRLGVCLALGGALCWGLGTVLLKPAIVHLTPVQANSIRLPLVALVLYLPRYWSRGGPGLRQMDRRTLITVAAAGVLGMGVGSLLFVTALGLIGPAKATTLSACAPVFGLVLAAVFLRERVTVPVAAGVGLCVGGVWLVL